MSLVLDVAGVRVEIDDAAGDDVEGLLAVAARAAIERSPRLLVHAGAVALDGQAVLFPGASGAGKSTMAAACVRRGLGYLSDEMVAVEPGTANVEGWSRPLMLTPWSIRALGLDASDTPAKRAVPCDLLGGAVVTGAIPVAHVVVMRRAAVTSLRPMPASEIVAQILTASFNHYRYGAAAWEAAAEMARQARGWRLDVGTLDAAADAMAGLPR